MGKTVGYNYLLRRLKNIWKPNAFIDLVALENGYYLVKFYAVEDYKFARDEGPWTILDHYLVVKEWTPDFDPVSDKTEKLIVWVRFPCLPIEYFDWVFLKKVGEKIGRPIRADHNTGTATRGRFATLCVEVDITKSLLARFKLKNRVRKIEYEGIHLVSFGCGVYGHSQDSCPARTVKNPVEKEGTDVNGNSSARRTVPENLYEKGTDVIVDDRLQIRKEIPEKVEQNENYGPWMLVKKPERKVYKGRQGKNYGKNIQGKLERSDGDGAKKDMEDKKGELNSRFNILYGLEDPSEDNGPIGEDGCVDQEAQHEKMIRQGPKVNKIQQKTTRIMESAAQEIILSTKNAKAKNRMNAAMTNQVAWREKNTETASEEGKMASGGNARGKSRQAAAEEEHTVVRGMNKGKNITRTVIIHDNEDYRMDLEIYASVAEHHQDPPASGHQDDGMMLDQEMEDNQGETIRGLELAGRGGGAIS